MRKLLLLAMLVGPCLTSIQAQQAPLHQQKHDLSIEKNNETILNQERRSPAPTPLQPQASEWGTVIGQTYRDMFGGLRAGGHDRNRIAADSTGQVSVIWPYVPLTDDLERLSFPAVGYNYMNANGQWIMEAGQIKVDSVLAFDISSDFRQSNLLYTNFGEMLVGLRFSIGYNDSVPKLRIAERPQIGTGTWALDSGFALAPGMNAYAVTNGPQVYIVTEMSSAEWDSLQVDTSVSKGVEHPLVMHRYQGGGVFDIKNYFFSDINLNNFNFLFPEEFAVDARDSIVAIVAHGGRAENVSAVTFLLKSVDSGATWSYQEIQVIDTLTPGIVDTLNYLDDIDAWALPENDGAFDVLIDNNGQVHVTAGFSFRIVQSDGGQANSLFLDGGLDDRGASALLYWNESMGADGFVELVGISEATGDDTISIEVTEETFPADSKYPFGGVSFPTMSVDNDNNLYLFYSALQENSAQFFTQYTRDIYGMYSKDGGEIWSTPINIAYTLANYDDGSEGSATAEETYPQAPKRILDDKMIHLTWTSDFYPGYSYQYLSDANGVTHHQIDVAQVSYFAFSTDEMMLISSAKDRAKLNGTVRAYPNPTSDQVRLEVELKDASEVQVQVKNLLGQEMLPQLTASRATHHGIDLNLYGLSAGVYLCTVSTDKGQFTQRIVKQ